MTRNQRISFALKAAGISQADLGQALKTSQEGVSRRLNADKEIDSFEFLKAVSDLTGKSVSYLYYGEEELSIVSEPKSSYENKMQSLLVQQSKLQAEYIVVLEKKVAELEAELASYKNKPVNHGK